jgi:ComF family protein
VRCQPRDGRWGAFFYAGAVVDAVRKLKFEDRPELARPLAAGWAPLLPEIREARVDVLVPVPLHASRLVERGYNQAALLARELGAMLRVPSAPLILSRPVATGRQTDLPAAARVTNVAGAFRVCRPREVMGRRVLLVDDVETTGATLDACVRALEEAGAARVFAAVIAQV